MLIIDIPEREFFDNESNSFIKTKECKLYLEHSLVSLSKWESKWKKPFLGREEKTQEEIFDYVKCMTINKDIDDKVYMSLTQNDIKKINEYIIDKHTATTFSNNNQKPNREIVTSELIYYWMIANEIPFECDKWHLERLLTLIRVCSIKNSSDKNKKMPKSELYKSNSALNAARKAKLHSKG